MRSPKLTVRGYSKTREIVTFGKIFLYTLFQSTVKWIEFLEGTFKSYWFTGFITPV